jgi:hypothetical protein
MADEDILSLARDEQRILLVADRDFGELIFFNRLPHAGVLYYRLPGAPLATKLTRLDAVLHEHSDDLMQGKFVVVKEHSIRIATAL